MSLRHGPNFRPFGIVLPHRYEATRDMKTKNVNISTPVKQNAVGTKLDTKVGLVPILRSGLGMVQSMQDLLPYAVVHHLGMYRTKQSMVPVLYYDNIPRVSQIDVAIILEPVIATCKYQVWSTLFPPLATRTN